MKYSSCINMENNNTRSRIFDASIVMGACDGLEKHIFEKDIVDCGRYIGRTQNKQHVKHSQL